MDRLSQSLEDYLEAILMISRQKRIVRVKDLAQQMQVKTASVIGALKKLSEKGLVDHEHYGYVALTADGESTATCVKAKHDILFHFLKNVLKVEEKTAEKDACSIEHYVSDETMEGIRKLIKAVEFAPEEFKKQLK